MFWKVRKYQNRIMLIPSIIMRGLIYKIRMVVDLKYADEVTLVKSLRRRARALKLGFLFFQ